MSGDDVSFRYTSYHLRVWRGYRNASCRALLENVATGERVGFNTLADLIGFLEAQIPDESKNRSQTRGEGSGRCREVERRQK